MNDNHCATQHEFILTDLFQRYIYSLSPPPPPSLGVLRELINLHELVEAVWQIYPYVNKAITESDNGLILTYKQIFTTSVHRNGAVLLIYCEMIGWTHIVNISITVMLWLAPWLASQITGVSIVYSTVCSGANQRKHQSSASLTFVRRIQRDAENDSIWWRHHKCLRMSSLVIGLVPPE